MLNNIKAEFRKLYSIRSSYIVLLVCLGFALLAFFYGTGFHSAPPELRDPGLLANQSVEAINFLAVIGSLVGVLLVTHEYRYSTISYTLTASRNRGQVLGAKILAITVYALIFSALFAALAPLLTYAGLHAHGSHFVTQAFPYGQVAWHCLLAGWAYFMYAYIIALLVRNQVGALMIAFVFPGVIEHLLELVFRGNSKYLPYHALDNVLNHLTMSNSKAAILIAIYVVGGWVISWLVFVRRDAN